MKFKKITASALVLTLCSSMLLTSCGDANKGKEIEELLEDTYGGRFTLTDSVAVRPAIYFIQSPIPSHYQYFYKWDQYKGEEIWVTTKGDGYQTNVNYILYRPELADYYTTELEKKFPGGVIAPYILRDFGDGETELEELDFEDALEDWDMKYMCILAVEDVDDHKAIEKAIDDVFGDYNARVEVHIASKQDVDAVSRKINTDKDELQLFFYYTNKLPSHEYYCYVSDKGNMKSTGRTGWFER